MSYSGVAKQQGHPPRDSACDLLSASSVSGEIYTKMARDFEKTGDTERASASHIEAAKWSLKEAESFTEGGWIVDTVQQQIRLHMAADSFAMGSDFVRTQEVLNRAKAISTSERGRTYSEKN